MASSIHAKRASLVPLYDTESVRVFTEEAAFFENMACEILEGVDELSKVSIIHVSSIVKYCFNAHIITQIKPYII